jgi:hypothetical protein
VHLRLFSLLSARASQRVDDAYWPTFKCIPNVISSSFLLAPPLLAGASGDFQQVTRIARLMVTQLGLGDKNRLGQVGGWVGEPG